MVDEMLIHGARVSVRHQHGDPPTLVCLHGAGGNRIAFDRLLDALSGHECVAVDRPGRMGSEGPAIDTFHDQATFVQDFIASEVSGDYVLVGHSLGGALTIELAVEHATPALRGIVLLATGARLKVHPTILALFERLAAEEEPAPVTPGLLEPDADPSVLGEVERYLAGTPSSTGLVDWRLTNTFDRMADLGRISVPTLVVAGTADPLTPPKYAEYLHTHIPSSELHLLEGATHMFLMERAPAVAELIRGFLARL